MCTRINNPKLNVNILLHLREDDSPTNNQTIQEI